MPSFHEMLDDKKTYPDDTGVRLADGVEVQLGEIRGGYMKDGDYRKKTTDVANQRRQLESEKTAFEQARLDAEAQLTELAKQAVVGRGAEGPTDVDPLADMLEKDPLARALATKVDALTKKIEALEGTAATNKETLDLHAQTYMADQHRRVLAALKKQATDRGLDFDEQGVIEYARNNHIPRLDQAYRLMEFDSLLKGASDKAHEEGHKAGMEEGKRAASQPVVPIRRTAPTLPQDAPTTFEEAAERALQDPEILQHMEGL